MLFETGHILATPEVAERIERDRFSGDFVLNCLERHIRGDWGNLGEENWEANERGLVEDFKLFSAYKCDDRTKIWIITEADRSATTILFPDERGVNEGMRCC